MFTLALQMESVGYLLKKGWDCRRTKTSQFIFSILPSQSSGRFNGCKGYDVVVGVHQTSRAASKNSLSLCAWGSCHSVGVSPLLSTVCYTESPSCRNAPEGQGRMIDIRSKARDNGLVSNTYRNYVNCIYLVIFRSILFSILSIRRNL